MHALAILGYLRKLKRGMGLDFTAGFLHTFSIKMFLIKITHMEAASFTQCLSQHYY